MKKKLIIPFCLFFMACKYNRSVIKHKDLNAYAIKMNVLQDTHINCRDLDGINLQGIHFWITGTFRYPAYRIYIEDSLIASYIGNIAQEGDYTRSVADSFLCIQKAELDREFRYLFPKHKKSVKIKILNICTNTYSVAYLKPSYRYCKLYHGQDSPYLYSSKEYWHIRANKYYKGTPLWVKLKMPLHKGDRIIVGKESL